VRDLSHSDIDRYRFEHPMVGPEPDETAPMGRLLPSAVQTRAEIARQPALHCQPGRLPVS
jgi:hypothetical protein